MRVKVRRVSVVPPAVTYLAVFAGLALAFSGALNALVEARAAAVLYHESLATNSNQGFLPYVTREEALLNAGEAPLLPPPAEFAPALEAPAPASPGIPIEDNLPVAILLPDRIEIPSIELDAPIVAVNYNQVTYRGQEYRQFEAPQSPAAGWHSDSSTLGRLGNSVINGHHNAYGEVFKHLVDLEEGQMIFLYSGDQRYAYRIDLKMILPERYQPLETRLDNAQWILPSQDERITLVTCWPYETNSHRLIIVARPVRDPQLGGKPGG